MELVKIGEPLFAVRNGTAAYGREPEGWRIYMVAQGKPCVLNIIDAERGLLLGSHTLSGSSHSWGIGITPDGHVFIGGDGYLYKYDPKLKQLDECGLAIEGETYFWRLTVDQAGMVYGGTYPGGKVFQYNPATKVFRDYGTILPGNQYARCMDVGPDGKVYVGLGTQTAMIVELDPVTGARRELPVPEGEEQATIVYDLDIVEHLLFARYTDTSQLHIYDLTKQQWIGAIDQVKGLDVSSPSKERKVYFVRNEHLHAYRLDTHEVEQTAFATDRMARDFGWMTFDDPAFPGESLVSMSGSSYWIYNPQTEAYKTVDVELKGVPVGIQSLTTGDDGKVYIGGYFAGGFSVYDPIKKELAACKPFGQTEHMIYFQDRLYLGVYTGAQIYEYNPAEPWEDGVNPRLALSLKEMQQDRPFAFTHTESHVVIGTIPEYGKLGGGLSLFDPKLRTNEFYPNFVDQQSVIALCYADGLIYGGTTVSGGLGIAPTEIEGKFFVWDPQTKQKRWEGVPVAGEKVVSAVVADEHGHIWGMTTGHLFRFSPDELRVEKVFPIFEPMEWTEKTHFWRGVFLQYDPAGYLYGNCIDRLFRFHIHTEQVEVLAQDVALFTRDLQGNLYATKDTELYQLPAAAFTSS